MKDFSSMIAINRFKLPEENATHAGNYYEIAEEYAKRKSDLDTLQDDLKLSLAQEELDIRARWKESDGKMTEAGVAAKLAVSDIIKEKKETIREKQKEVNILDAAKTAMEHRKHNLDNLTSLLISGIYATPDGGKRGVDVSEQERALRRQRRESVDED